MSGTQPVLDLSQRLQEKLNVIVEVWIATVYKDRKMESARELSHLAVRDHIPVVLSAMVTVLSPTQRDDYHSLIIASLEHGTLRAEQGFDAMEIAREYRLLRQVIVSNLEEDLLDYPVVGVLRALRLVHAVIDEAVSQCFKSYMQERLKELEKLQSQIDITNQELNRLVRTSHNLFALLAEEIRTPLMAMIDHTGLFLRQQRQETNVQGMTPSVQNMERVLSHGQRLIRLVNDALELARYESGQVQLRLVPIEVRNVINHVLESVGGLAHDQGLALEFEGEQIQVITDPSRLQEILSLLLHRAIHATLAQPGVKGPIRVQAQQPVGQQWELIVSDPGISIPPEDQPYIFEPYTQLLANEQSWWVDSTGMELPLVARLVALLQGKIKLASPMGEGSTFIMTFPLEVTPINSLVSLAEGQA